VQWTFQFEQPAVVYRERNLEVEHEKQQQLEEVAVKAIEEHHK
jgi:hypothetical protein